jgi:hypothetical protein
MKPRSHAAAPEHPNFVAPEPAYAEFAAAVKRALSDFHSADLLAQNPLLRNRIGALGADAGPAELRALLTGTVETLFGNPHDEKLRRVIELTYFQPAPKQEAVADRLSLLRDLSPLSHHRARPFVALALGEPDSRAG